jgi:hypothetical protein
MPKSWMQNGATAPIGRERPAMKTRLVRIATVLGTLAALAMASGAPRKFH